MAEFTHFDQNGSAIMVDVSDKEETHREATAVGSISMSEECYERIRNGSVKKGDVLGTARLAGIMGTKHTAGLIPLCHPIPLTGVNIEFEADDEHHTIRVYCSAKTTGPTGVEMEALTGVTTALLTVYDMCKAIDRSMVLSQIRLVRKSGGRSGEFYFGGNPSAVPEDRSDPESDFDV